MKHLLLAALFLTAGYFGFGQCGTRVVLTSSQTQHLGADSNVQRTEDENTIIEFDKSTISILPGNNRLTGKVDSITCNWTTPYKVGKTRLKVTISNEQGETQKATIIIEGKDGKIVVLAGLDDKPDERIRLTADKFEEKKSQ